MKVFYLSCLLSSFTATAFSQDLVYLADGKTIPGKVTAISTENIKLYTPDSEASSYGLDQVLLAVNSSGDYLVVNGNRSIEEEKNTFLGSDKGKLPSNIIIGKSGEIIAAESFIEDGGDLIYIHNGQEHTVKIGETAAVFRRNGTHKLYVSAGQAVVPLKAAKPKISTLVYILNEKAAAKQKAATASTTTASAAPAPASIPEPVPVKAIEPAPVKEVETAPAPKVNMPSSAPSTPDLKINMEAFSKKALQKTEEFSNYLQIISGVNNNRDKAMKSINMAVDLFLNEEARVEVSSTKSQDKNKYKIRDYLNRLQFRSGQYDKIIIEYADINYASEFKKGADGNFYGVVTFVQKFRGFVDGEVVYGDITKRNLTIVLKQYEKAVEGQTKESWDVFLADVGVVETKKL